MTTAEPLPSAAWTAFFDQQEKALDKIRRELDEQRAALGQARAGWDKSRQELDAEIARLRAENEQLRKDRRALLLKLFPPTPQEEFDPAEYQVVPLEELMAEVDALERA